MNERNKIINLAEISGEILRAALPNDVQFILTHHIHNYISYLYNELTHKEPAYKTEMYENELENAIEISKKYNLKWTDKLIELNHYEVQS